MLYSQYLGFKKKKTTKNIKGTKKKIYNVFEDIYKRSLKNSFVIKYRNFYVWKKKYMKFFKNLNFNKKSKNIEKIERIIKIGTRYFSIYKLNKVRSFSLNFFFSKNKRKKAGNLKVKIRNTLKKNKFLNFYMFKFFKFKYIKNKNVNNLFLMFNSFFMQKTVGSFFNYITLSTKITYFFKKIIRINYSKFYSKENKTFYLKLRNKIFGITKYIKRWKKKSKFKILSPFYKESYFLALFKKIKNILIKKLKLIKKKKT